MIAEMHYSEPSHSRFCAVTYSNYEMVETTLTRDKGSKNHSSCNISNRFLATSALLVPDIQDADLMAFAQHRIKLHNTLTCTVLRCVAPC